MQIHNLPNISFLGWADYRPAFLGNDPALLRVCGGNRARKKKKYLKRMHEVQRLISTVLQDIHNWTTDARIILSVYVHVWHRDCEQNVYSYFEKGCQKKCTRQSRKVLWVVLSSLFFKKNERIARATMDVSL